MVDGRFADGNFIAILYCRERSGRQPKKIKLLKFIFFNKCFTFCNQYSDFPFHLLTLAKII